MKFEIEKGVPLPMKRSQADRTGVSAAVKSLMPGDSFLIPIGPEAVLKQQAGVHGYFRRLQKEGRRFATRKVEGGLRVWRIE